MAYPSYSGHLKNPFNDVSNEDDEFGDFTSAAAATFPSIGTCLLCYLYAFTLNLFVFCIVTQEITLWKPATCLPWIMLSK